ncbi:DUF1178 family protein [Rhodoplanes sp. TEM]|uniref:DUF1178 family protein n=1 Tax=Rhodoplanes tepidamans TaxID=200616 RepID=A0ABT5J4L7_RHOTP|nr:MULTISPECIES: DUF1178 family protein [Rhodoplanes]MDC7784538.1 DUF1178 family protein [Rhodoplanes tepidamans]MDC7984445.1 DUF1178 family protein [Rhodoplanes sp. TEM]MDQ0355766.1 hypothetical protein [Rhodoplanes tepidamans]
MIRYALACRAGHAFESWFRNSADFDDQSARGFVACPVCGSAEVEKALMTPRLGRSAKLSPDRMAAAAAAMAEIAAEAPGRTAESASDAPTSSAAPVAVPAAPAPAASPDARAPVALMSPQEVELRRKLRELRDHLVKTAEHVGPRFPDEARRMHYGEIEHRSIYGEASPDEVKAMLDEGIEFHPLPMLPDERN